MHQRQNGKREDVARNDAYSGSRVVKEQIMLPPSFAIAQAGVTTATFFRLTTISDENRRLLQRNTTTIGGSNGAIAGD